MRYTSTLITFLPSLLSPVVTAKCWKDAGPQANQQHGLDHLRPVTVLMSGQFRKDQVKFACIDDYASQTHYYLTVTNYVGDEKVDAGYLESGLRNEMKGCRRGGHTSDGKYEFK
jgi:hypothetical protein